jgi:hypothetical protein
LTFSFYKMKFITSNLFDLFKEMVNKLKKVA